jgi:hypothetical protein
MMAILRMSSIFAEAANRLPKEARAKLPKAFMLLTNDPRHPSLQVKKIEGAIRPNVYECRLDQSWRIVLQEIGNMTFDLVYVGAHDEAISYGARLRETGAHYGAHRPITERLSLYLAGDDQALEFAEVTPDDLEGLVQG